MLVYETVVLVPYCSMERFGAACVYNHTQAYPFFGHRILYKNANVTLSFSDLRAQRKQAIRVRRMRGLCFFPPERRRFLIRIHFDCVGKLDSESNLCSALGCFKSHITVFGSLLREVVIVSMY